MPTEDTIAGFRDRAILSVGLQVRLRCAEIAALKVGDLHQNRGFDSLRVTRKGGRRDALAINPQAAARIRAYLDAAGHAGGSDGAMFRPRAVATLDQVGARHTEGVGDRLHGISPGSGERDSNIGFLPAPDRALP